MSADRQDCAPVPDSSCAPPIELRSRSGAGGHLVPRATVGALVPLRLRVWPERTTENRVPPEWARSGTHGPTGTARAAVIWFGPPLVQLVRVGRLGNVKHRNFDHNPELTEAVFQYGSDGYELSVAEAKRLMSEIETIMNGGGSGLIRATIDGAERAFLISAGALVTFHVPIAVPGEDPEA